MDPLSDVLSLLKPRSYMFRGLDVGGKWSIHFPPHKGINCYTVFSGECWLIVEGVADAMRLKRGDCVLLPRGQSFRLASDTTLTPVEALTLFSGTREGDIAIYNGGGDVFGIGGYFDFSGKHANVLLSMLPAILHIRKVADKAALRWSMKRIMLEIREPQLGGFLVAQHLAQTILIQALRAHLAEGNQEKPDWLFALVDRQMSTAIKAIHEDPAHRWTVQTLAELTGMSRTAFAVKFKNTVGQTPLGYVTHWRMLLAGDRLMNSRDSISQIAEALGYESDSAFSTAFKRTMGCSPRQYDHGYFVASHSI